MSRRKKVQSVYEFFVDGFCLILSSVSSMLLFGGILGRLLDYNINDWASYAALLFVSYVVVFSCLSSPINIKKRSRTDEFLSVLKNSTLTLIILSSLLLVSKNPIIDSRYLFLGIYLFDVFYDSLARFFLKRIMIKSIQNGKNAKLVAVYTTGDRAEKFVESLSYDWTRKITAIAIGEARYDNGQYVFSKEIEKEIDGSSVKVKERVENATEVNSIPVCANKENFLDMVKSSTFDEVFINIPKSQEDTFDDMVEELESMGLTVHINIPVLEKIIDESKYNNFDCGVKGGCPIATLKASVQDSNMLGLKRTIDVIGGIIGLIISIPIIAIVAVPLLIESKGPLFFKQERVGLNGRVFKIYKLRSMYADAEKRKAEVENNNKMNGLMFKVENDPRITKVGRFIRKTSIDELPQFINVIKGEMSLIGTRPPTVDEFEKYESYHKRRLSMRPGITGMWQISGRSTITDFEEVVKLDLEYIDNWSIALDIMIIFRTITVVLKRKGAE